MSQSSCQFISRVWIARIKQGIPRKKLARLLGHTSTSQLSRWEGGHQLPSFHNALLLSAILRVPVDSLFACHCRECTQAGEAWGSKPRQAEETTPTRLLEK